MVSEGPAEVLTRSISKSYNDISYTLNDEEDDLEEGAEAEKSNANYQRNNNPAKSDRGERSKPKNI